MNQVNNNTIENGFGIFYDAMTSEDCLRWISKFEDDGYEKHKRDPSYALVMDDTSIHITRNNNPEEFESISKIVHKYYLKYITKYIILNHTNCTIWPKAKLQKTEPEEGYHGWHCEDNKLDCMNRILAFTIYLNDVEEGGETEFLHQRKRIPATKGTLCLFPANYMYTHRGNPPISNNKYIITGWIVLNEDNLEN